jgi:hypothetical protein
MTATNQRDRSPAPGIIPDPVYVHDDPGAPTVASERRGGPKPGRRNPLGIAAARVMSALRGDKHMVDAYPAAGCEDAPPAEDAQAAKDARSRVRKARE